MARTIVTAVPMAMATGSAGLSDSAPVLMQPPSSSSSWDDSGLQTSDDSDPLSWHHLASCQGFDLRTWAPGASGSLVETLKGKRGNGREFHRFPDLPFELRARIWRFHLEQPRIVVIRGDVPGGRLEVEGNELGNLVSNARWYCQNRSPALFRVCSESRVEALSFFRIRVPVKTAELQISGHPEFKQLNPVWDYFYINPDWDMVVYLGTNTVLPMSVLASDLLAFDPRCEGIVYFGSTEWPRSIWTVHPDPGEGMATMGESLANLKSYTVCRPHRYSLSERINEGYISLVSGEVGRQLLSHFDRGLTRGNGLPAKTMIRKALVMKGVPKSVVDNLVMIEMTRRPIFACPSPHSNPAGTGWRLQLTWQPPERQDSGDMFVAAD